MKQKIFIDGLWYPFFHYGNYPKFADLKNNPLKIYQDVNSFKAINPVVTIGIFDGVHLGHVQILERLKKIARSISGETIVVTLWPHPRLILGNDANAIRLLSTLDEKISLIEKNGIDNLIILPFTKDFANISYDEFIRNYLVNRIRAKKIIVGYNHHFGKDRKGGFNQLKDNAEKFGFSVERLTPVVIENKTVSSSVIRQLISEGDLVLANRLLGYVYSVEGKVVEGKKIGKQLGFPTANVHVNVQNKLIPLSGVYAVKAQIDNQWYNGMLNIGIRPTIADQVHHFTIEVHILHFDKDIYGKDIKLQFIERIRNEEKFQNVNELIEQLKRDRIKTSHILGKYPFHG
jgi:riboflavin kinase/FMN adenylyltransferase